ncbi:MAG: hypothetical protein JO262_19130, partial [Solirubrobacterales bacterium]|nr:hypothetical protein [Solirubrobacterales bacterium]
VDYLQAGRAALGGVLPTKDDIVFERFFDETGGMQMIVHSPLGARINRALGLGLRKKFCLTFDFELQAAASNDAVLLSLGPQHSFPLEDVPAFLRSHNVRDAVSQAVLRSPMFTARWRWNLNRSLAVLRRKGGKVNPFNIQRMESDDLMAAVFPSLAACQDNAPAGPIEIPDHPLVRETLHDCLHEAMDIDGLGALVRRFEEDTVRLYFIDTVEPSVLAHEILNGAPFTYLDEDTEIGERRSRAVPLRRGLPVEPRELGRLDPAAIERVRAEATPDVRVPDELHDVLLSLVGTRPRPDWALHFETLTQDGRSFEVQVGDGAVLWGATERRAELEALFPQARFVPDHRLPDDLLPQRDVEDDAAVTLVRGHLEVSGPVGIDDLTAATGLSPSSVTIALEALRARGFAVAGRFEADRGEQWCARRLLARIHSYTRERRRAAIRPMTQEEWQSFLAAWSHTAPGAQLNGRAGLAEVIEQLQGFERAAGEWERIFAERVAAYRPEWLDALCLSGEVAWGRLSVLEPVRDGDELSADRPAGAPKTPSRRTPITFMLREDLPWLLQAHRGAGAPAEPGAGAGRQVLDALRGHGALFHSDLRTVTNLLPTEVEEGLWDGVARGLITADGWAAVRSLLSARSRFARRQRTPSYSRAASGGRRGPWRHAVEGRWTLLPAVQPCEEIEELAEMVAWQLLRRWGVVCRDVYLEERLAIPWREVLWALRRLEARGLIRGGHFVTGVTGEQFAEETTLPLLRPGRRAGIATTTTGSRS